MLPHIVQQQAVYAAFEPGHKMPCETAGATGVEKDVSWAMRNVLVIRQAWNEDCQ